MALKNNEKIIDQFLKDVGSRLKEIKEKKGLTYYDLEEAGYPNYKHLIKLENGERRFQIDSLIRFCLAVGIEPYEVLKGIKLNK